MLNFSETNIYNYKNSINLKKVGFCSTKKLLPFQFRTVDSFKFSSITNFELINGTKTISLLSDISKITVYQGSGFYWFVFLGVDNLKNEVFDGVWQIKITINSILLSKDISFYSSFFSIICENEILGQLEYYNTIDFDNKIYKYGYKNRLNLISQIIKNEPFYKETIFELANGQKKYEYQSFAEVFSTIFYGDIWVLKEIEKIKLLDTIKLTIPNLNFSKKVNFLRSEISSNYERNFYKITVFFTVNNIDKNICINNYNTIAISTINIPTDINGDIAIDNESRILVGII